MKTTLLSLSALLIIIFGFRNQSNCPDRKDQNKNIPVLECPAPPSFAETIRSEAIKHSDVKSSDITDQDWYSKAMENIQKEEYNISYNKELGAYQSPNRKNNIRFIYHKDGFNAVTRDTKGEDGDDWSVDLRIRNYELGIENEELNVIGNKAYVENENIRIDYTNNEDGMRQDFIVKNKPDGDGKLRLNISADTKLKMVVGADALMFKDDRGVDRMKYSALKCWDANGRELRAFFEKEQLQITNDKLQIAGQEKQIPYPKFQIPNCSQ